MPENPSEQPLTGKNPPGGTGDVLSDTDYAHKRGLLRDIRMAIRKRWIVPKDAAEMLPNEMFQIATQRTVKVRDEAGNITDQPNHRSQIAATQVLLAMEAQNQADEHAEQEAASGRSVTLVVERSIERTGNNQTAALPPRPAADDRQRPQIQRGDVRPASGEDDHG